VLYTILGWIMKSKVAKVGGGVIGGSGVLFALVFGLNKDLKTELNDKMREMDKSHKLYVQLVLKPVEIEIKHLNGHVKETKQMVRDIRNHLLKSNN